MRDENGNSVPLRQYVERILEEKQKALELAFKAQQEALAIAARNVDDKLEQLNRLRQEVTQDRGSYVTKDKHDADMKALNTDLDRLNTWQNRVIGIGLVLVLGSGVIGGLVGHVVLH
jgi:SMC interacting uncharacterized protein involved in chromosome segregation